MPSSVKIQWLDQPEDHDYPAAQSFLSLIYDDQKSRQFVTALKAASVTQFKAKDIFRASGLALLGKDNSHVAKDLEKLRAGLRFPPCSSCATAAAAGW